MNFTYKGRTFKDGDKIIGTIEGKEVQGRLSVNRYGEKYFCQDHKNGSVADDLKGYCYSWKFSQKDENTLSDGVVIINVIDTNNYYEKL